MRKKEKNYSRKQQRKQSRIDKKTKKNDYFINKKARFAEIQTKTAKRSKNQIRNSNKGNNFGNIPAKKGKQIKNLSLLDETLIELKKEKIQAKKLQNEIKKQRGNQLMQDAAADDLEIKRLEKQLGLKKRSDKSKSNFFASDGLDYLLEVCDRKTTDSLETAKGLCESDDDDFGEDIAQITGSANLTKSAKKRKISDSGSEPDELPSTKRPNRKPDQIDGPAESELSEEAESESDYDDDNDDADDDDDDQSQESDESDSDAEDKVWEQLKARKLKNDKLRKQIDTRKHEPNTSQQAIADNDESSVNVSDLEENNKSDCDGKGEKDQSNENDGMWEDIYGRTRDKEGNVVAKYQPPHLRQAMMDQNQDSEKLQRLKKQMKGLLNRLAENNMINISSQIENLFSQHSRNEMNETLFSLYVESLFSETATPERLVAEHALLLAILSANVGAEVAAHCLQRVVTEYHRLWSAGPEVLDKRTNNMLLLLSFMCHFKLFHSCLLFDIMDELMSTANEKEVELVLLILRTVGFTLRKEDPVRLKEFIIKTQQLANNAAAEMGTRAKFLLETVMAVKNNNVNKISNYNPEYGENLKKILKASIRKGNYNAELKISFDDLLKADERGRWWVVGSAWTGELPGEKMPEEMKLEQKPAESFSNKLIDLAKKQRMNTDARRGVFCVIMSAEDYLDAFEKLLKLRLHGPSEREIMNVLLHCLLQEKKFNPYYEHLARKFCLANRRFQIMLQFATWDRIQEIGALSKTQVTSLAKFLGNLIVQKNLAISILKVVELGGLDKASMRFMRQVLLTILLSESDDDVMMVFARVSGSKPLKMFRDSLRLFLHHFVLRNTKEGETTDMELLTTRVQMADRALSAADRAAAF